MLEDTELKIPAPLRWIFVLSHFIYFGLIKIAVIGFFGFLYLYSNYLLELPEVVSLSDYRSPTITKIYSPEGEEVSRYARENRVVVSIDEIPDHVLNAFIAAEDKRFFEHSGVDPVSIARAVMQNVASGGSARLVGASTITQQVAKLFFTDGDRTIDRKIKEALMAVEIDRRLSKREILELYLNRIEFGLNAHGVASAGRAYFGKELDELTVSNAAFLAALPKGPSQYHPLRNTERATDRRDWVVGRMLNNGFITDWDAWAAMKEPLPTDIAKGNQLKAGDYFTDQVRRELITHFGEQKVFEEGLVVQTTVDKELQAHADAALRRGLVSYDRRHGWRGALGQIDIDQGDWRQALQEFDGPKDVPEWDLAVVRFAGRNSAKIAVKGGGEGYIPISQMYWARAWRKNQTLGPSINATWKVVQPGDVILVKKLKRSDNLYSLQQIPQVNGGLVAITPKDGHVVALAGGFSFALSQYNRASQAKRQPGSTFKPFVYLAALNRGKSPRSRVDDTPLKITFETGEKWEPKNAGGSFWGPMDLQSALKFSRNIPTIRLAREMGRKRVSDFANLFGIEENMPMHLSNALGSRETTLLQMTGAYAMLAKDGELVIPTTIRTVKNRDSVTIFDSKTKLCIDCLTTSPVIRRSAQHLPQAKKPWTSGNVRDLKKMLRSVIQSGTAKNLADGMPSGVAGKTGTTNGNRDAWFVGFTDDIVIGVYVGFDTPRSLGKTEQGGKVAGPIFKDMLLNSLDAMQQRDPEFELPVVEAPKAVVTSVASTPRSTTKSKRKTRTKTATKTKSRSSSKNKKKKADNLFGFKYNKKKNTTKKKKVVKRSTTVRRQPQQRQVIRQQPTYQPVYRPTPAPRQPAASSGGGGFSSGVY